MSKNVIRTDKAPNPAGAYSQGIRWGERIFTSGQVGVDPATGKSAGDGIREQTRQVMLNVKAVVEAGGATMESVVKTTCFLSDINDFAAFNEIYKEFFPVDPPARSTIQAGLVPPWLVEIEAIATRPED